MKNLGQFIQLNQSTWSLLENRLDQIKYGSLHKAELDEMGNLYRKVSSHLAYAQTYFPEHETTQYLNHLIIRAHNILYGKAKKGSWKKIVQFFTTDFPNLCYERSRFFFLSFFIFTLGSLIAFVLTYLDQEYANYFLGPGWEGINPKEIGQQEWNSAIVSSEIMVNNIMVSFLCFAYGILFGVMTAWTLFDNGMLLGALAAIYHRAGEGFAFWAFIWPHGVIELTVIFIAGAAGLSLAYRIFVPGEMTRRHALLKEGLVTIKLMLGVVPLFMIAGIVEGYITPAPWPHWTKYLISLFILLLLMLYLGWPFIKHGLIRSQRESLKSKSTSLT